MKPHVVQSALRIVVASLVAIGCLGVGQQDPAEALPPADDIPEEILRAQPSLQSRSPRSNRALSPSEYGQQLQDDEADRPSQPDIDPELQHLLFLLKLRQALRPLLPNL